MAVLTNIGPLSMSDVFISYPHRDIKIVCQHVEQLTAHERELWADCKTNPTIVRSAKCLINADAIQ